MIKKNKKINDFDVSSQIYFKEISKFKPLSLEEEKHLWEKYKINSDLSARDKLITSNLKFVASVASKYQGRGLSYSDLIAEGNCGLLRALDKFDYEKGYKTISYSVWWIKQAILEALKERNGLNGEDLPLDYEKQCNNEEEDEVISIPQNNNFIEYDFSGEENENKLRDQKIIINSLLEVLNNRERNILIKYYGLDNKKTMTLEEIGKELGLTKERIRQILVRIFKKIRSEALRLNISANSCF